MKEILVGTAVWGEDFCRMFTEHCLGTLLARGNLPELAHAFPLSFLIVTRQVDVARLRAAPQVAALERLGKVEFEAIPAAMLAPSIQGHETKMAAMNHCHNRIIETAEARDAGYMILFPDQLYADNCMRFVAREVAKGARAIMAGSYSAVRKPLIEAIETYCATASETPDDLAIAIPARVLARISIEHLHPLTRQYIVGSREFSPYPCKLYWAAANGNLLARHWAPNPVFVYPERYNKPQHTIDNDLINGAFSDYAGIVFARDSDEFLFIEQADPDKPRWSAGHRRASPEYLAHWLKNPFNRDNRFNRHSLSEKYWIRVAAATQADRQTEHDSDRFMAQTERTIAAIENGFAPDFPLIYEEPVLRDDDHHVAQQPVATPPARRVAPPAALNPKSSRLHGGARRPYYIDAPAYRRTSGGIRVMHLLCHALNLAGEEAYVYTDVVDPKLRTPTLNSGAKQRHRAAGVEPIVVYPEIIHGNPRGARSVVRYVLNKAGLIGGTSQFDKGELVYAFGRNILPEGGDADNVLFLPPFDLGVFNNDENPADGARSGILVYPGRYPLGLDEHSGILANARSITNSWPETHEELADVFRRSELLYCFESSAIAAEAVLCGCPVVLLRSPFFDGTIISSHEFGTWGIATENSAEAIAHARSELPKLRAEVEAAEQRFWHDLQRFVEKTQQLATGADSATGSHNFTRNQADYALWRKRRTLQEIDGQILAERMVSKWRHRPRFAIGVTFGEGESELLANTIDSVARQWYPEWQLAIFAPGIPAPEELAGIDQISWVSDADVRAGFGQLRGLREADFYAILPVGVQFEDHTLQALADELNASPQWLAVYTDHDETSAEHAGAEPRFKPDFNPELFYSTDYIGPSVFICREALDAFAGSEEIEAATPYGLLLRIFEQTGTNTLGHLPDPLIHCPQVERHSEFEQGALARHFERRRLPAEIENGWFENTRRVRFDCPADSAVSVIVLTHSQPGYLRRCLESLLRTAAAPVVEIIAVAHRVTDGDLIVLLGELEAGRFGVPGTVLAEAGEFAPAAFRNRAAQRAKGDFLLFVDDDTEYFQEGWLAALVGHARAGQLAAVGPRLVSSTDGPPRIVGGGQILGLKGLASNLAEGSPGMFDARCDYRLVLDQAISALPGSCLLVDRGHFEALGGFDAEATAVHLHDLDFCIRSQRAGKRLAWLASVDVAHQESITVRDIAQTAAARTAWFASAESERARMLERHIDAIASDPNYNRNLSLREPYTLDIEAIADWNPRFRDRPRFLGVPLTTGAGEYRLVAPFRALAKSGLAQCTIVHPVAENTLRALMAAEVARLAPDTVVIQNCIEDSMIRQFAESARFNPRIDHIATIDDRLGDLPRDNPLYPIHARQGRTKVRRGLSHCRRLIVTTEPLKHYFEDLIGDIRVVPNRLEREVWAKLQGTPNDAARPRIGWVGAMQHAGDLKLIEPIVRELAREVDWVLMGMCPEFLKPFVKEVHEFVSIRDYPAKMASLALDLALAPLEIHPFNECKSNLRLIEYGALGWPVICTDIDPYRTADPPVLRLANNAAAWISAIRERLADRSALRAEGARLREWVHANYILEDGLEEWLAALSGK